MDLREEKDSGKGERIVDIEMNPEQRVVLPRIELAVECEVCLLYTSDAADELTVV